MRSAISGPLVQYGNDNPQQISDTEAGPSIDYQSNALIDSRFVSQATAAGEGSQGGILAVHSILHLESLSAIPATAAAASIAAAQAPTVGGFFTLASAAAAGIAINIPLVPQGTAIQPGAVTTPVIALDFGFAVVSTTAASAVVSITNPSPTGYTSTATYAERFVYVGQRVMIASAGNAAGTLPLIATVLATERSAGPGQVVQAAGNVLLSTPALFTGTGLPMGTSDQEYGVAVKPVAKAGALRAYDPSQMVSRQVIVTASAGSTGTVTIRGYDVYEQPMSETQTIVGSGVSAPKKAFKYISSVQLNTGATVTGTLSVGTNNTIGLPQRSDMWPYLQVYVAGAAVSASTGYTPADQTLTATATTGDVRGTYTMQTVPNGTTNQVLVFTAQPIAQAKLANNINAAALFGVVNA